MQNGCPPHYAGGVLSNRNAKVLNRPNRNMTPCAKTHVYKGNPAPPTEKSYTLMPKQKGI